MADECEDTLDLHGSCECKSGMYRGPIYGKLCMDPALLPDITTTYQHMQKSDGTVGLVEKASSGRMSPIRKRSAKDVEQQIQTLEKENFDLKLRIYFLEQQKGINKDDTLKVNIDLRVQLHSIHEEFQRKQDTWEQMMAGYENHIEELEQQVHKDRSSKMAREVDELKEKLVASQNSLREMEQLVHDKAFESETQLQAAHAEIEKLHKQLADRERQLTTSPSQANKMKEDLLSLKHSLDEKENELQDKTLHLQAVNQQVQDLEHQLKQVAGKMTEMSQTLSQRDHDLIEKDKEMGEKMRELHAVRAELTQKDFSLRKAQIDLQTLNTASADKDAELERQKAELAERFSADVKLMKTQLEQAQSSLSDKDSVLRRNDEELSARDQWIATLEEDVETHKQELKLCKEKYNKELANLQRQILGLEEALKNKDLEIESLRQRLETGTRGEQDSLHLLRAALQEKDTTIASLLESIKHKDQLLSHHSDKVDGPDCTSTPREETNPAISHLCVELAHLKKENEALKAGRPMDITDEDMDIDGLSDSSDTRDLLHTQLAKHNAKAQSIQAKLLEMSREDVDGGSDSSSMLKDQVSALMRMRESDKKVIDALKKHISLNTGGEFNPEVVSNLASDVQRLSGKIKEMHKNGMRSNRSVGSRSQRSGASSSSSVYREEIEHLKRELDMTRHEVSKTKAELHKLSDESEVVSKLQSTEALVRQQAEEKKRLLKQIAYYRELLENAGLLPKLPPERRSSSVDLSGQNEREGTSKRTSRIPQRSSSAPRSVSRQEVSSEERVPSQDGSLIEDQIRNMQFRNRNVTADKIQNVMDKLGGQADSYIPVVSQSAPANHSRIPKIEQRAADSALTSWRPSEANVETTEDLRATVEQYQEEVQTFGRPVELKRKLDELGSELNETKEKLHQSMECNHQLEESYEEKIREKDVYIDELEEKIRQLQAQLRAFYGGDMSGGMADQSGSVTLELAGSRPPSSLHSVPGERASSRVVSLNGLAAHDRSTSGVAVDRSTLSFSGSAQPPSESSFDHINVTLGSSFHKTADESGISRGGSQPLSGASSARSHPGGAEDAGTRATAYMSDGEISPVHAADEMMAKPLSPLTEVSSALSRGSDIYRDSGLGTLHRSKQNGGTGHSVASLVESLDGPTEKARKDDSVRFTEVPSLGGSLVPGDAIPTQENILNTSNETINKLPLEPQVQAHLTTGSPEKGRLHSPTVSEGGRVYSPAGSDKLMSRSIRETLAKESNQSTERYEKKTSPNKQLYSQPAATSWSEAERRAFGQRSPSAPQSQRAEADVLNERPISSASTQTETDDFTELGQRLVSALNKEDSLKEQRSHLGDIHKEYEEALRKAQEDSDELRSRLSDAEAEAEAHLVKRLDTAEMANDLQQQLLQKADTLQMMRQKYEEALVETASRVDTLTEQLSHAEKDSGQLKEELKNSQVELRTVNDSLIDTSKRYKEAAKQLRDTKNELKAKTQSLAEAKREVTKAKQEATEAKKEATKAKNEATEAKHTLQATERELRASQAELRMSKEALTEKTYGQVELTKQLHQKQAEKDELVEKVHQLEQLTSANTQPGSVPVETTPSRTLPRSRAGSQPRSVRRLQDEITSILDTSEHIKSNLASALEQSVLNDTIVAESQLTAPQSSQTDCKLTELLKLNLNRVEELNGRISELLEVEREALAAIRQPHVYNNGRGADNSAARNMTVTEVSSMAAEERMPPPRAAGGELHTNTARLNRSQNNAADRSISNDVSTGSSNAPISYQQVSAAPTSTQQPTHGQSQPAGVISTSSYMTFPEGIEQGGVSGRYAPLVSINDSTLRYNQPAESPANYTSPQNAPPAHHVSSGQSHHVSPGQSHHVSPGPSHHVSPGPSHLSAAPLTHHIAPSTSHVKDSDGIANGQALVQMMPHHVQHEPSQLVTPTQYYEAHSGVNYTLPNETHSTPQQQSFSRQPVAPASSKHQLASASSKHQLASGHPQSSSPNVYRGSVTQPPVYSSTPVLEELATNGPAVGEGRYTERPFRQQPLGMSPAYTPASRSIQPTMANVYETITPVEHHSIDAQQSTLPAREDLPSTRSPLYAVSDLINYELLKKQNEESLMLLSGLEARIQGRLDGFTSASPLEDMEWCTLKELKSTAENLRTTLFAEKKYITQFYIQELPQSNGQKYEEMLRAYKRLESRYDWAKAQLMELMKATKLDEDLIAQMKRVKSILKASKENIKSKTYSPEKLRQKPV